MNEHHFLKNESDTLNIQQIVSGVQILKSRKNRVMFWAVISFVLLISSVIALFVQKDFVYQWFGVSEQVRQLHIPLAVDGNLQQFMYQPDYLWSLFSWFGWLFLKLTVSFIGAFISISLLKKIGFFRIRFQSFVLKFVGWLISLIILWSALTYVQYDLRNDEDDHIQSLLDYQDSIQQSQLYRYLQEQQTDQTVQAYLLAQAALMHGKDGENTALAYNTRLIQAERTDPNFLEYGFKAEQLWTIQNQLYGQSKTGIAKSVDLKVTQAQVWSERVQLIIVVFTAILTILSLVFYGLALRLSARVERIMQQLDR